MSIEFLPPPRRQWAKRKTWTDADISYLKHAADDPDVSIDEAAQFLGVTKNAVVGKAHRLDLVWQKSKDRPLCVSEVELQCQRRRLERVTGRALSGNHVDAIDALATLMGCSYCEAEATVISAGLECLRDDRPEFFQEAAE